MSTIDVCDTREDLVRSGVKNAEIVYGIFQSVKKLASRRGVYGSPDVQMLLTSARYIAGVDEVTHPVIAEREQE